MLRRIAASAHLGSRSRLALSRAWHSARSCATAAGGETSAAAVPPLTALGEVLEQYKVPAASVSEDSDPAAVARQLRFLTAIGVPDVGKTVEKHPRVLSYDPATVAAPRLEYLLSLGCTDIGSMVGKCPQLLAVDIEGNLHPKVSILRSLGVGKIAAWLRKNPYFVKLDLERDMRPTIELLRSYPSLRLGHVVENAATMVFKKPATLKQRLDYYETELGIPDCGRLVSKHPALLSYAVETNVKPKARHNAQPRAPTIPPPPRPPPLARPLPCSSPTPCRAYDWHTLHRSPAGLAARDGDGFIKISIV